MKRKNMTDFVEKMTNVNRDNEKLFVGRLKL